MRSMLFAPAGRPDLVAKLPRSAPDAVILDLEDAVPADHKAAAREALGELVRGLRERAPELAVWVRVNQPGSAWFADDLAALPDGLAGVVVPKLERAEQLEALGERPTLAGIESALGVMDVRALLTGPVVAAYFGAEDYVADLGGVRTKGSEEVLYARSRVALACRVAGVTALDQVVVDVRDDEAFRADARRGRALGFHGKLCVHPGQVALAHEAFTPSAEEVDRARRILGAAATAAAEGRGAIVVDGEMIDEPMLRVARDVLARAR
jgi:citrate lyase subunit beta/citryl-CoA lyase